jgi:P-type Ca2+ transporter type 2C
MKCPACADSILETGLSSAEAIERLKRHGPNSLPQAAARSAMAVFASQFKSLLIVILLAASALSAAIGDWKDAAVILAVVGINALVGFFQEHRAERSMAALKGMLPASTRVRRDGCDRQVDAQDVVPGDVVLLEAGDRVPADGRLTLAVRLEIDESALTGESMPSPKAAEPAADAAPLAERTDAAYMNTLVTRGRGEMLVTATGAQTEMGRLAGQLAAAREPRSPLQVQLDALAKRLGLLGLALVALLSFLEVLRGTAFAHIVLDAIALAVAAMPEGLPVVVTVTLALGMQKMARQRAIVKRLSSVETLGCTTVICSDKTGTLTLNQMTARAIFFAGRHFSVSGEGYRAEGAIRPLDEQGGDADLAPLLVPVVACNDSSVQDGRSVGDPMEAALLVLAAKAGVSAARVGAELPRIAEIPFDSAHKFMATFHREGDSVRVFVKGAPDVLLARCALAWRVTGPVRLDDAARGAIDAEYARLAKSGMRGLLVASASLDAADLASSSDLLRHISGLTFVGLVGLADPPRPGARAAIAECHRAGIAVKMITGDHKSTALAIAAELGIPGAAVTGAELDEMDSTVLAESVDAIGVFARVTPAHKVKIVRALQSRGHVVAMTGDGVNDAPALKTADIGVAMGMAGTAVSKEAAAMVLADDNFSTIVAAVRHGRMLYDNILKFVRFQLSTTAGAILTVFFAPLAGLPEPFSPIQILWVALIMDGPPAVSLALDAARPGLMHEPPRHRGEPILPFGRLAKVLGYGATMMAGTLLVLHYALKEHDERQALTMAFTTFVLFQLFNVFNARNEKGSCFNPGFFRNPMLWACLGGVLLLQAVAVHFPPAQAIFGASALSAADWAIAIGVAASILAVEEILKLASRRPVRAT